MHVELRKAGKRKKYYLAYSFRKCGKARKIRRYLGANLTAAQLEALKPRAIELLEQQAKSQRMMQNPLEQELPKEEMGQFKALEKRSLRIRHLSEEEWKKFTEVFTYNTNAIEGSTIALREVKEILESDKWPGDKSKEDISETYGVAEAVDFIRATKEHISLELIKTLHRMVFHNSKEFAGKFRPRGVEVVIRDGYGRVVHVGAPAAKVEELLKRLTRWYNANKGRYPPLVTAVVAHNQFEVIHPFQDGNGRVGRLLLNNILLKHKYPPVNIGFNNRREYYDALQEYQNTGNIRPMVLLLLKEYRELKRMLKR